MKVKIDKNTTLIVEPGRIGFDIFVKGKESVHYPYHFRHACEYLLFHTAGKKAKKVKELLSNIESATDKIIKELSK